ncbi:uncharacterized protein TNCV_1598531 [Trichonephila clavipes]|nr:uncharacterized protein TNCV_1598531 [Trichonephila clavipes]
MYIQDRFGSCRSIESTKTDWNCTRYSIITCLTQTSDSLARLTQTLARMPDVMDMRDRNIKCSVEEGERKVDVAKAFEILLSSLSTILKNKEKIFSASSSRVRKRVSKGNFPRLEQCLISWMRQYRGQNIAMGGSLLKEKPKTFAKELGIEFSASEGWLTNFKKRNGIVFKKDGRGKLKCRH